MDSCYLYLNFNPRSLVGNDGPEPALLLYLRLFQSTFPRGERRWRQVQRHDRRSISIHVPSWGTTETTTKGAGYMFISIHVPSWGTTAVSSTTASFPFNFNPRSLVGNDFTLLNISSFYTDFNPRSLVGNDSMPCWRLPSR